MYVTNYLQDKSDTGAAEELKEAATSITESLSVSFLQTSPYKPGSLYLIYYISFLKSSPTRLIQESVISTHNLSPRATIPMFSIESCTKKLTFDDPDEKSAEHMDLLEPNKMEDAPMISSKDKLAEFGTRLSQEYESQLLAIATKKAEVKNLR